jgi:hypothetical protein
MKTKKDKNYNHKCKPLKAWNEFEPMPADFWNYRVNPITGYYIKPKQPGNDLNDEKKYKTQSRPLPKHNTKQFR